MKENYKGYLLLESMVAMVVIVTSVLMIYNTIIFMLSEEKKRQDELEMAILLYEVAASSHYPKENQGKVQQKSQDKGFTINTWKDNHIRIEGDSLSLELIKE